MEKKINDTFTKKFNYISTYLNTKNNNIEFIEKNKLIFTDGKQKKILKATFKFYGIVNNNNYIWNTSIPLVKNKYKIIVENIRKKKDEFYQDYIKTQNDLSYFYYAILDNDMTLVEKNMIENINKLILYLTDDIFIFNIVNSKGNIQFISIDKILEIYK